MQVFSYNVYNMYVYIAILDSGMTDVYIMLYKIM